jgi:hypothetical protein
MTLEIYPCKGISDCPHATEAFHLFQVDPITFEREISWFEVDMQGKS